MKRKERFFGILLSLVLMLVLTVGMIAALPVGALAEGTTVTLGAGALTAGNKVWFGSYSNSPVLWRVLHVGAYEDENEDMPVCRADGALLISNDTMESIQFNPDTNPKNVWKDSNAQTKCRNYYDNWLTGNEKGAVLATSVSEEDNQSIGGTPYYYRGGYHNDYYGAAPLTGERFFFLSAKEADKLFASDDDRKAQGAASWWWWLRSPYAGYSSYSGVVDIDGWVDDTYVYLNYGVRPAFNLNLSSVLFTTEIQSQSDPQTSYKLTLPDDNMTVAEGSGGISRSGNAVTVPYSITGDNKANATHVALLITNKGDTWTAGTGWSSGAAAQYYEAVAVNDNNTVTFTLSDSLADKVCGTDYDAYILAVDANGNQESDYASAPVGITIPAQTIGGSCGDNVTWELKDNTLTISGTGAMWDYKQYKSPWYSSKGNITKAEIEKGVTSIGNWIFLECLNLESVTIPDGVTTIGDGAFYSCMKLSSVTISEGVTSIGKGAFTYTALASVEIPESVESIGIGAFEGCENLTSINILQGVTSIENSTFFACRSLTSIVIPTSVTSIGKSAFSECYGLTSIVIPTSVTSIGDNAFDRCSNLKSIVAPLSMKAKLPGVDNNCWLVVDQAGAGVVSGEFKNREAELTATANEGFTFVNWINDNGEVSDDNPYTFTPTNGMTLTAKFSSKADQTAPAAPVEESKTSTSVTLTKTDKYQYSKDGTNWQDSNIFDNLAASTEYTFYQRVAGDDNHNPSAASPGTKIKTTQYTLVYDHGDGTGTMAPEGVSDNDTYQFPECGFNAPADKTFYYWEMSGNDRIFYPKGETTIVSNCADTNGVITVTAHWKFTNSSAVTKAPEARDLTYNGKAQALVTNGEAQNGTMNYVLGDNNSTAPTTGWSESIPAATDAGTYYVWYKAAGDSSHGDSETACVTAKIKKRSVTLTSEGGDKPYDGSALTKPDVSGWEQSGNTGFVTGEVLDVKATGSVTTVAQGEVTNTITYTPETSFKADNYKITKTEGKLKITPKAVTVTVTAVNRDYEAGNKSVSLTAGTVDGAVKDDNVTVDVSAASGEMEDDKAGENKPVTVTGVKLGGTDAGNYELSGQPEDVTVWISKVNSTAATVTANNRTYDGTEKPLVTVTGTTTGGEMQYALGSATEATESYTASIPSGTDAVTYYVWYMVVGDANHNDTEAAKVKVTISKDTVTAPTIASKEYTGQTQTATVAESTLYTVTANNGGTNVGSYNVVLTLTDSANYKWSDSTEAAKTLSFQIIKATANTVTVNIEGWTYGETAKAPTSTATFGTAAYTYAAKGSTNFSSTVPTNAGEYTVKAAVAGTDNYSAGEATKDFTIARASITPTVSITGWTVGETANTPSVAGNTGDGAVTYSYAVKGSTQFAAKVPTDAGEYTVKASIAATVNFNAAEATADFTIAKKIPAAGVDFTVEPLQLTYTGVRKELVRQTILTDGLEIEYSFDNGDSVETGLPMRKASGVYQICYRVIGNNVYETLDWAGPVTATITMYATFSSPDFVLPAFLAEIGEEAFAGDTSLTTMDASGCAKIDANAFRGCTNLKRIRLSQNCEIDDTAFDGCVALRAVFAPAGGTTAAWCASHDINFVAE